MGFDFRGEVTKRGGQFKPFSHKGFMDQKPDMMTRGHCFGLTIVWLSRYVRDRKTAGADLLGDLSFTKASQDPKTIMIIRQIQNMANSSGITAKLVNKTPKAERARAVAEAEAAFGVGVEGLVNDCMRSLGVHGITFGGVWDPMHDMSMPMVNSIGRVASALYAISLPTHEVGAIVDRERNVFKFLDVNYGQAVWKGAAAGEVSFLQFMEAYVTSPNILNGYAGHGMRGVIGYANAMLRGEG
jgi:hypothetical protein